MPFLAFHFPLRSWLQHSYSKWYYKKWSIWAKECSIVKNYGLWNTHAYNMEDLENLQSIPKIHHHQPLKTEIGATVLPALANPSARKMELGPWGRGEGLEAKRERKRSGKKVCFDTHQNGPSRPKNQTQWKKFCCFFFLNIFIGV